MARAASILCGSGGSPASSFSGLPGVTSHHSRSSLSRCSASRESEQDARRAAG